MGAPQGDGGGPGLLDALGGMIDKIREEFD
jgi:hypothetical protein